MGFPFEVVVVIIFWKRDAVDYINKRCDSLDGMSVSDALLTVKYEKGGKLLNYAVSDLRYDDDLVAIQVVLTDRMLLGKRVSFANALVLKCVSNHTRDFQKLMFAERTCLVDASVRPFRALFRSLEASGSKALKGLIRPLRAL